MLKGKKFTLFGIQPNDMKVGGIFLMAIGALILIVSVLWGSPTVFVGIILLGLSIGAYRGDASWLYLGIAIWVILFALFCGFAYLGRGESWASSFILELVFFAWVLWELIKSTPIYKGFMSKGQDKKPVPK